MITKPQFLESDIWANGQVEGVHIINPTDEYKTAGWIYGEKPPYTVVNWLQKTNDELLVHLNQNGILEWDSLTNYNTNAYVNYSGELYLSNADNTNSTPGIGAEWDIIFPTIPDNLIVTAEATRPDGAGKIVQTNPDGLLDISLLPIGGMRYIGSYDMTAAAPTGLDAGDFVTALADGVVDASWTGIGGTNASATQAFIWDGSAWNAMAADTDLMGLYLQRDGSDAGMSGQLKSTLVTGTAPLVIASTTQVDNLNVELLGGQNSAWHVAWANFTDIPLPTYTITGDSAGTLAATELGNNISIQTEVTKATNSFDVGADDAVDNTTNLYGNVNIGTVTNPWNVDITGTLTIGGNLLGAFTDSVDGLVPTPSETGSTKFLRQDGTWVVPSDNDTTYNTFGVSSDGLVPGPASESGLFLKDDGTWSIPTNTTYATFTDSVDGLVPTPAETGSTKFLRQDGTWVVPTDNDTTYSDFVQDTSGLVPGPTSAEITANKILRADGTWVDPVGIWPTETDFTATAAQTDFTVNYTVGSVNVFIDGVKLRDTEYTATNGTSIVLDTGVALDTWVQVVTI